MKNKIKRIMSLILALVLMMTSTSLVSISAFAKTADVYLMDLPRGSDSNQSGWGHSALEFLNGWNTFDTDYTTVKAIGDYEGNTCYCIEPGVSLFTGDSLSEYAESFWDDYPSKYNKTIDPDTIKVFIGRIMQYGWTGTNDLSWNSSNSSDRKEMGEMFATQILIWETVVGERDENFNKVDATDSGKHNVLETISKSHPCYDEIMDYYDSIVTSVKNHTKIPSFMAESSSAANTIELTWNGSEYTTTLTDSNKILSNYDFSSSGLTFSVSGNKLTITASSSFDSTKTVKASNSNNKRKGVITWSDSVISTEHNQLQDIVTYGSEVNDPVYAYLNVKISNGNAKIIKQSEDGIVSGIKFTLSGNGITKSAQTNSKGELTFEDIPAGTYTVTEESIT